MEEQNLNNVGDTNQSPPSDNTTQTIPQSIENSSNFASAQVKYAGFWIRFAASFVDGVIVFLMSIPLIILAFFSMGGEVENSFSVNILSLMISWGYHILMTDKYQATLGKRFVGIKVVKEDLGRASLGNLILRETAGKLLSQLIFFIGYIVVAFTSRKRALHDIIGGTVVVFDDNNIKSRNLLIGIIASIVGFFVILFFIFISITLVSLQSARDKSEIDVFKSSANSLVAESILICDEEVLSDDKPAISGKYLGKRNFIKGTNSSDCGPMGSGEFEFTIDSIGLPEKCTARITEKGATFEGC